MSTAAPGSEAGALAQFLSQWLLTRLSTALCLRLLFVLEQGRVLGEGSRPCPGAGRDTTFTGFLPSEASDIRLRVRGCPALPLG